MTDEEVRQNVAENIRILAEQVIEEADNYAVGMEWLQSLKIVLGFEVNCVPTIAVEKNYIGGKVIRDPRCKIWTRCAEQGEEHGRSR